MVDGICEIDTRNGYSSFNASPKIYEGKAADIIQHTYDMVILSRLKYAANFDHFLLTWIEGSTL